VICDDLETLREIGAAWLEAKDETLEYAVEKGVLREVRFDDQR
jgi:hypothetical protein